MGKKKKMLRKIEDAIMMMMMMMKKWIDLQSVQNTEDLLLKKQVIIYFFSMHILQTYIELSKLKHCKIFLDVDEGDDDEEEEWEEGAEDILDRGKIVRNCPVIETTYTQRSAHPFFSTP